MKKKGTLFLLIMFFIFLLLFLTFFVRKENKDIISVSMQTKNQYRILVDVESSKLYLFESGQMIKEYSCAGGKQSTPSPIGTWTIISKGKWGEGFGR